MVYIPKASQIDGRTQMRVGRVGVRPWTLNNTSQKNVARATSVHLALCAEVTVHSAQRGFVRGRRLLDNKYDTDFTLISAPLSGAVGWRSSTSRPLSRAWHGVGPSSSCGGWASRGGYASPFSWASARQQRLRHLRLGTLVDSYLDCQRAKQGCPTSGSLWALVFDPIVRAAPCEALRAGAPRRWLQGLGALLPVLLRTRRAAGLCLNLMNNASLTSALSPTRRCNATCARLGLQELNINSEGTPLGFFITPGMSDH